MSVLKYSTINSISQCSTQIYPLGPLYQCIMVLYSNVCVRKVIAEMGTRVPVLIPVRYPFLPARRYASTGLCDSDVSVCPDVRHKPVLCLAERKQDREMYTI